MSIFVRGGRRTPGPWGIECGLSELLLFGCAEASISDYQERALHSVVGLTIDGEPLTSG